MGKSTMMTAPTVEQLLLVLGLFRESRAKGEPLRKAYARAVQNVADRYSVRYQTIGDGSRRRLGLTKIEELYVLLEQWGTGDPGPLANQLKFASDPSTHDEITRFFESADRSSDRAPRAVIESALDSKSENFSFALPEREARHLRALALLEGVTPSELLGSLIGPVVAERMRAMLR